MYLSTKEAAPQLKQDKNIKYVYKYINLRAFKYLLKLITLKGRFNLSRFSKGVYYRVFNKCIKNIRSIRARVVKYINLKWLLNIQRSKSRKGTSFFSKVIYKFNQFKFYYRFNIKATKGYTLLNKVYNIVQQIARMDYRLYLSVVTS